MNCPSCDHSNLKVVATKYAGTGEIIRRRWCKDCGHRWYTVQRPEQIVANWQISYEGGWSYKDNQSIRYHEG
jgi:transcriptional regulator NrdR family protein